MTAHTDAQAARGETTEGEPMATEEKAFRHWVTFNDDEGRQLVIQHNADTSEIEVAWLTEGGELINGFWTMAASRFVDELRLTADDTRPDRA